MNFKITKALIVSGLILGSLGIYKIYQHTYAESYKDKELNSFPYKLNNLTRTRVFTDSFLTTQDLLPLIEYRNKNGKAEPYIVEERLESTLKPFIKEKLRKIFINKGWNFEELSGKIYYQIRKTKIEILLMWKGISMAPSFTNYDHFEIIFF